MEEYPVHHVTKDGSLIVQLPLGRYGRLPPTSTDDKWGRIFRQIFASKMLVRGSIICETALDGDGYVLLTSDPVAQKFSGFLSTALSDVVPRWLPDLVRAFVVCPLGATEEANVIRVSSSGAILTLNSGLNAVALGEISPKKNLKGGNQSEDDLGEKKLLLVKVLHFSLEAKMASCVPTTIPNDPAKLIWSAQLQVGNFVKVRVLLVCPVDQISSKSEEAKRGGRSLSDDVSQEPAHRLLAAEVVENEELYPIIYVDVPKGVLPRVHEIISCQLVFVPHPSHVACAPFCLAQISQPGCSAVPATRLCVAASGMQIPFLWRQPKRQDSRLHVAPDEHEAKIRKRKIEEAIDKFERQVKSAPTDPDGFDKLLLSEPSNSYVWTRYMAYWVSLQKIDAARNVAENALSRIAPTEGEELFNIWAAYLSLENLHGTAESLSSVFRRAIQRSDDALKIHFALAEAFHSTGKKEQLLQLCRTMSGKYGRSEVKVWEIFGKALIEGGKRDQLKKMFKDMSRVLNSSMSRMVIEHIAIYEFKQGDISHGRQLFEGLIEKSPRKSNVWFAYIDQELLLLKKNAAESDVPRTRALFERLSTLQLPAKAMQVCLTKFLNFEQIFGGGKEQDAVKAKAKSYVDSKIASATGVGTI